MKIKINYDSFSCRCVSLQVLYVHCTFVMIVLHIGLKFGGHLFESSRNQKFSYLLTFGKSI